MRIGQWILGAALLLLIPLGWLQYGWIGEISEAEFGRRQAGLEASVEQVAKEFDRAVLESLGPVLPRPRGGPPLKAGPPPEDFAARVERWRAGDGPPIILSVRWSEEEPKQRPDLWVLRAPGGFLEILLNMAYLREHFLPELLQQHFGDRGLERYAFRLVRPEGVVYSTGETEWETSTEVLSVGPPGRRTPWHFEAGRRGGTLKAVVSRARLRNLALSGATIVLLAAALIALALVARRAERLSHLQMEFTAGVTHDLKTPLAVICSAGENLAGGVVKDPAQVQRYGALVRSEGRRLTRMVEQVLSFAGVHTFAREPVDLRKVALAAAESEAGVTVDLPEPLPVMGDEMALQLALRNLVENAVKHGKSGMAVRGWREGNMVMVRVEDEGPGIDDEDLPHLFDPYYRGWRTKQNQVKGFGLGLALVKRIMEGHDGTVEARNGSPTGSMFTVKMPAE